MSVAKVTEIDSLSKNSFDHSTQPGIIMTRDLSRMFLITIVVGSLLLFSPFSGAQCEAQTADDSLSQKLDTYFKHFESNNKFMGTVAVSIDGKIVFDKQYGFSAVNNDAKITPDSETEYYIGSITKMFTSVMILQLTEIQLLSLDSKLSDFFPELKNADKITIEQMLGHRSGLGSITDDPAYLQWNTQPQTREQMLERIAKQGIKFEPGERTEYSNSNYLLLGYIIEDLTGHTYAEELQSRIAQPLGLNRTEYASGYDPAKNVALSFKRSNGQWNLESETDASIPHGAGSLVSTPSDLIVFIEALFAGKLIEKSSLEKMKTMNGGLGLGMFQFPFGSKKAFGHNGGIDGFQSSLGYFPDENISIALIGNGFDYPMNDLLIGMLTTVFGGEPELPTFIEVEVAEETLKLYEGVYAADGIPLKLTIKVENGKLTAQGTGQPAFPLTPTSDDRFEFRPAGVVITFKQSQADTGFDSLQLNQAGQEIVFKKE